MANENMEPITNTVTLNLSEYLALNECAIDLENLQRALYQCATLNYNATALRFDDELICLFLGVTDGDRYERKLAELKAAAEQEA